MKIYYGRFLESDKLLITGRIYYEYFESEEAIHNYVNTLRELNKFDILEAIGEMKFNSKGRLVVKEGTEKLLYDPEREPEDF